MSAGEDVKMKVKDALSRFGAVVHDEPEGIAHPELARDFDRGKHEMAEQRLIVVASRPRASESLSSE